MSVIKQIALVVVLFTVIGALASAVDLKAFIKNEYNKTDKKQGTKGRKQKRRQSQFILIMFDIKKK